MATPATAHTVLPARFQPRDPAISLRHRTRISRILTVRVAAAVQAAATIPATPEATVSNPRATTAATAISLQAIPALIAHPLRATAITPAATHRPRAAVHRRAVSQPAAVAEDIHPVHSAAEAVAPPAEAADTAVAKNNPPSWVLSESAQEGLINII